jgi:hypothetical protein
MDEWREWLLRDEKEMLDSDLLKSRYWAKQLAYSRKQIAELQATARKRIAELDGRLVFASEHHREHHKQRNQLRELAKELEVTLQQVSVAYKHKCELHLCEFAEIAVNRLLNKNPDGEGVSGGCKYRR